MKNGVDTSKRYLVVQRELREKLIGTSANSKSLLLVEDTLNEYAELGYRLHTITSSNGGSKGFFGGDRTQVTMFFEKLY